MDAIELAQRDLCKRYGADYRRTFPFQKLGISNDVLFGCLPINGLRHLPTGDTCGWYIWSGEEMGLSDDYFEPMHLFHMVDALPNLLKFLGLAPGWRFLLANEHEDVWYDESLLMK